jgi:hypothetical protein
MRYDTIRSQEPGYWVVAKDSIERSLAEGSLSTLPPDHCVKTQSGHVVDNRIDSHCLSKLLGPLGARIPKKLYPCHVQDLVLVLVAWI